MKPEKHADNNEESNLNDDSDGLNDEIDVDGFGLINDCDYLLNKEGDFTGK